MIITWEVEDGYIGGSRPHKTEIPDYDLESCETDEEKESMISEYIQEDFEQSITWYETHREE